MAFTPLTNGAQLLLIYGSSTEEFTNSLHLTKPAWVEADAISLSTALEVLWETWSLIPLHEYWIYKGCKIYDERSSGAPVYAYPYVGNNGGYAGEQYNRSKAAVVTFYSTHRGRAGRGRWYWGGLAESMVLDGDLITAAGVDLGLTVEGMLATCTSQGWTPVIKSCQQDGVAVSPANAWPITSSVIRNLKLGNQRRRSPRP